jgi:lipid II:glycine glycyltransferase (peptidoglycan interpeptide bridge formation enzyme)
MLKLFRLPDMVAGTMIFLSQTTPGAVPPMDNLFQTGFWGTFKTVCGQHAVFFSVSWTADGSDNETPAVIFPFMLLIRQLHDGLCYAYAPKAPDVSVPEYNRGLLLEELAEAVCPYLPENCICLRYDLPWQDDVLPLQMNWGTKTHNLCKAPTDYLCTDTVVINLSLPSEQILARMRQTTRNCIRKSYRSSVDFVVCGRERLREWFLLYEQTAVRKKFFHEKYDYFDRLFSHRHIQENALHEPPPHEREIIPLDVPPPLPRFYLMTAEKNTHILSGIILAVSGRNAYYLYAGSSIEQRQLMPNYGLQWEAMRFARSNGCISYDLMGIPPDNNANHPMAGLYIFKTGFGGTHVHFSGTWDFPYDADLYRWFCLSEQMKL